MPPSPCLVHRPIPGTEITFEITQPARACTGRLLLRLQSPMRTLLDGVAASLSSPTRPGWTLEGQESEFPTELFHPKEAFPLLVGCMRTEVPENISLADVTLGVGDQEHCNEDISCIPHSVKPAGSHCYIKLLNSSRSMVTTIKGEGPSLCS